MKVTKGTFHHVAPSSLAPSSSPVRSGVVGAGVVVVVVGGAVVVVVVVVGGTVVVVVVGAVVGSHWHH